MNDLQKVLLENLKEFVRVCEKHNLRYYLVTGTALGAVRHKGFIPWDDDVDVAMPRPDAMKLLALKDEFKEPYFLQHFTTDPGYPYPFMKLRNSATTFEEGLLRYHHINHGIYIDIFIIDGMSKTSVLQNRWKNNLLWIVQYIIFAANFWQKPRLKTFIPQVLLYLVSILLFPFKINNWLIKALDRSMAKIKFEEATLVGAYMLWGGNKEAMDKRIYGPGVKMKFETMEAIIPANYDAYLINRYGNYMQLPPEHKRVGHHHPSALSTTVSYRDYYRQKKRR
ncbi:MAG: LicD family protein [Tenericutes bacterium ADurb.Bin239]|jgi:lipopolysaccharide cholinephosphotransferase|nr:MAG: LicD family protein [Tenericutes bacterium ADurb.Bin239]